MQPTNANAQANFTASAPASFTAKPLAGRRILLVEDGPDNQHLISLRLRQAGAMVELAENGRIGMEMAQAAEARGQAFDLIFMDMQMPEMDGYTATSRLRAAGYRLPIVAITAHAMSGDREKCLKAGCDEYTAKPIDNQRMIQVAAEQMARFAAAASCLPIAAASPVDDRSPLVSQLAGESDMHEAIDRFVARLQTTADGLAAVLRGEPASDLSRVVHQLKGSAGGFGFPTITAAAASLEQCLKASGLKTSSPLPERDALLARLISLCRRAQPCMPQASCTPRQEAAR